MWKNFWKLLINTFFEKSSFLKEIGILKIILKGTEDFIIEAVCIPSVCTPLSNQQCNKVVNVFPHFKNLKFADNIKDVKELNINEQNKKIDLLIGADYYHKFFIDEIIRDKEGEPVAQNTYFSWVLIGNISTFDSKNPSFVTLMQIITSTVLDLSTEFENEVFENESLSSGATSSIFHPHAAKKCCAAHGYKMLHVAHQLNTAANSIFAALFCFFDHKIHFSNTISSWPVCMTNICRKFFVYYITICLLKKSITS